MTKLAILKNRLMKNPEFKAGYKKADAEYRVIEAFVAARTKARLTQSDVAQRLGTTQSSIARLEGGRTSPSWSTISRYADATGSEVRISIVPKKHVRS